MTWSRRSPIKSCWLCKDKTDSERRVTTKESKETKGLVPNEAFWMNFRAMSEGSRVGMVTEGLIHKDESYEIIGACFEVYRELGPGFLEAVYQESLHLEMNLRGIPFVEQPELDLVYKGSKLQQKYVPDFVCYERVILEIKAVSTLTDVFRAQVHNYLRASKFRLGLLVNFGHSPRLEYERIIH